MMVTLDLGKVLRLFVGKGFDAFYRQHAKKPHFFEGGGGRLVSPPRMYKSVMTYGPSPRCCSIPCTRMPCREHKPKSKYLLIWCALSPPPRHLGADVSFFSLAIGHVMPQHCPAAAGRPRSLRKRSERSQNDDPTRVRGTWCYTGVAVASPY